MRKLSRQEIRQVDETAIQEFGIPGVVLMENAGRGSAYVVTSNWVTGTAIICCGKGNNGGDGFVISRYLEKAGWNVKVRLTFPPDHFRGDARVFLESIQRSGTNVRTVKTEVDTTPAGCHVISWAEFEAELQSADLVIDALLGTGLSGEVRSPFTEIISAINAVGRPVLAIDLPSGLDCDTGKPLGCCIRATRTATMVAQKLGFGNSDSMALTGPIDVIDIGLPIAMLRSLAGDASQKCE